MAVSSIQTPAAIMPAFNPIVFTVNSTNKAQCNFKYICDVYVENVFVARLKLSPAGSNGYASFKVNRVLEDFVSYDLKNNLYGSNIFAMNSNTCKAYVLKFGEEYDNSAQCNAGTTVYPDLLTTTTYYVFNAARQYGEWLDWDPDDYDMYHITAKFMTDFPNEALINMGHQLTFNFLNSGFVYFLRVQTYSASNTLLGEYYFDNNYFVVTGSANKILTVGVGPENLNNSILSVSSPSSGVPITNNVHHYTVELFDAAFNQISEIKTITLDKRFTKYPAHRLWWLNRFGGFDSYNYGMKDARTVEVNQSTFTKLYGRQSGSDWSYNIGDRGKTVISVDASESRTYNSNWLTEQESLWMEQLFTSPEVYVGGVNEIKCYTFFEYFIAKGKHYIRIPSAKDYQLFKDHLVFNFEFDHVMFAHLNGAIEIGGWENDEIVLDLGDECIAWQEPPVCIETGIYHACVCVSIAEFEAKLDPVIIASKTYEEKKKYRTKNISYELQLEPAYKINVQRNS